MDRQLSRVDQFEQRERNGLVFADRHADLHVPADYGTIGAAHAAAIPGDRIVVAAGTFAPSTNGETFPIVLSTAGVSLIGRGPGATILDAEGTDTVLVFDGAARVAHMTITGGDGDWADEMLGFWNARLDALEALVLADNSKEKKDA